MLNLMLISNHCMKRSLRLPLSIQPDTLRDKLATQANKKQNTGNRKEILSHYTCGTAQISNHVYAVIQQCFVSECDQETHPLP